VLIGCKTKTKEKNEMNQTTFLSGVLSKYNQSLFGHFFSLSSDKLLLSYSLAFPMASLAIST